MANTETVIGKRNRRQNNHKTAANYQTIKKDIEATESSISDKTIAFYINALRRIFIVEDMPAWLPSLRSKTAQDFWKKTFC